jgi:Zn-dependent membrane protease YugP
MAFAEIIIFLLIMLPLEQDCKRRATRKTMDRFGIITHFSWR